MTTPSGAPASVRVHRWRGVAAVTLASGTLQATFVPEMNLLGASLRLDGEEYLALPGGIGAYRRVRTTGLPIHGTMSARHPWEVRAVAAGGRVARLRRAGFEYAGEELLAAFPFPHRLETAIDVDGRSLSVTTTIRPSSDRPVLICFGYHPYFRLPGGRRPAWRLLLPRRRHAELDKHGIPTGRSTEEPAGAEPIGARTYDDLFELTGERRVAIQHRGRRLSVLFGAGYPYAQVYAPPGAGFVCLEPMSAATNALVAGGYPVVGPGASFTARFSIRPERLGLATV